MDERKKEIIVKHFRDILEVYEFELILDIKADNEAVFRVKDLQNGNLGKIENDEFRTLGDLCERMNIYHEDYIYNSLQDRKNDGEKIEKDDFELITKRYLENENVGKVLNEIEVEDYKEIVSSKNEFLPKDMLEILDEDEKFYKNICEKNVNTMLKEMLLKMDNKVLHIFIEDEYIDLKNEGKININNYQEYLDNHFTVHEYESYQELYNCALREEIAYDINDLRLFDEEGKWNFYLTFEELKKIGYGFMVKEEFPLIEKYAIPEEKVFDFFDYFTLEQLKEFEETLNQYFNEKSIIYNEDSYEKLESKEDVSFNRDIIKLACGLITYDDFIEDYKHINDANTKENLKQNEANLDRKEVEKDEEINNDYE